MRKVYKKSENKKHPQLAYSLGNAHLAAEPREVSGNQKDTGSIKRECVLSVLQNLFRAKESERILAKKYAG